MTIYNGKTMEGIAWGNNGDSSLDKAKVVPGSGQITLMPKDPTRFNNKTREVLEMEGEAKTIQAALNELEVAKSKRALTADEQKKAQYWFDRQKATIAHASTRGYVPALHMKARVNQSDLGNMPRYLNSVKGVNDFKEKTGSMATWFRDLTPQESEATGVRSITLDEGKATGLADGVGPTDFVEFDILVGHDNIQALGSRESVKENNAINTKINNRAATQSGSSVQSRYQP